MQEHHAVPAPSATLKVRVLGCSGSIGKDCRTTSFLLDDDLLLDAGTGVGDLTLDEILNPTGWVLLGAIMDPRTGLGRYRDYRISNYQLMLDMIDYCSMMTAEEILAIPDVKERVDRYLTQQKAFAAMLKRCSTVHGKVVVVDLRNEQEIFTGNRFTLYALYPECNISIQIMWGLKQQNTVFTVGYSILNRTATADVGALMLQYGGGGHLRVGTCQVENDQAVRVQEELLAVLQQ